MQKKKTLIELRQMNLMNREMKNAVDVSIFQLFRNKRKKKIKNKETISR